MSKVGERMGKKVQYMINKEIYPKENSRRKGVVA